MKMLKEKILAIIIAAILLSSTAFSIGALSTVKAANTYPIPGTADGYDQATYTAITQGMYWVGMDANASATRLLLWNRFHDQIPTHVYIIAAPTPVGIGQQVNIVMFNPETPPGGVSISNQIRYTYTFQIVKPDGTVQNFPTATPPSYSSWGQNSVANGVFVSDSTGSTYMLYTPDQTGNYTLTVKFLQLVDRWNSTNAPGASNDYYGITLLSSTYTTTLVVQQEPVSLSGLSLPAIPAMPTAFWTRPIEGQNTNWYSIASNWYNDAHDLHNGGFQSIYQPDGTTPLSGHILWTRPTEDNGVVGGTDTSYPGNVFNAGSQYQPRFNGKQIILFGRLYYEPNNYYSGANEIWDCVDLKTGQLIYEVNATAATGSASNTPLFANYYSSDTPNEHGIVNPGWLFSSNYAVGYQPATGAAYLHLTNVPGTVGGGGAIAEIKGPAGENLRYVFVNKGTTASPNWYLMQWNSSLVIPQQSGLTQTTIEANVPITPGPSGSNTIWNGTAWVNAAAAAVQRVTSMGQPSFDWNVTSPIQFTNTPTVAAASLKNGILWGWNASYPSSALTGAGWPTGTSAIQYDYQDNVTIWAISLKPGSVGQLIYIKTIQTDDPATNTNLLIEHASADEGTDGYFAAIRVPDMSFEIFNMRTGNLIGITDAQADSISPYGYYTWPSLISLTQTKIAYGMLYTGGYSGSVSAYYLNNASLAWRYEVIPPGTAGVLKSSPGMFGLLAAGVLYVGCHEHSALTPLEAGNNINALNATTGKLIWSQSGWAYPLSFNVADGVMTYWNNYDGQVYAIGQGPTQLTVTAPQTATSVGTPVVIRGAVMDISAGTQQTQQKLDFPNGVPAVSDNSMSQMMEYVYMQKSAPTNATGVPVSLYVVDANNNYRSIGTATSDASGMFTLSWAPDIPGSYTVIASYTGSQAYYGSYAETSFVATLAPTSAPTSVVQNVSSDTTQMYVIGIGVAIIIAIAIVGVLIMLSLRKRP